MRMDMVDDKRIILYIIIIDMINRISNNYNCC